MQQEKIDGRVYPMNAIRVCIDEENGDLKGRIYSKMSAKPLRFRNCTEMFLIADQLFDECGYPQTFQEKRSFQDETSTAHYARPKVRREDEEVMKQCGVCRTVDILVRSRRRAGWQGVLSCEDARPPMEFQSEMELLKYLAMARKT